jgi:predicted RNA-binding protein
MAVKFISYVDEDSFGNWFIELTDTLEETTVICKNLDEYKENIEELGSKYAADIEVVWTKSKTLSPKSYQDLNDKMAELQKEYQDEIDKINEEKQDVSGFLKESPKDKNPNG